MSVNEVFGLSTELRVLAVHTGRVPTGVSFSILRAGTAGRRSAVQLLGALASIRCCYVRSLLLSAVLILAIIFNRVASLRIGRPRR